MRRPVVQTLLTLALACVFVAPVAAVEPGGAGKETLRGTLQALYIETFRESHAEPSFSLRTRTSEVPLEFADHGPEDLAGAVVEVTGRRHGRTLHVADPRPGRDLKVRQAPDAEAFVGVASLDATAAASDMTIAAESITTAAVVAKNIAVIPMNFKDNTSQPFTASAMQSAFFTATTSVRTFFEEQSKGRMTVTGKVFGWQTIDATSTSCDWTNWITLANNKVTAAGGSLSGYTNFAYIMPKVSACPFSGVAYVNGNKSVMNGTISVQVITHELGHNFGLSHANALYCLSGSTRVSIAASGCESKTYQDPFSTMGNNALRHNHGSQLGELGWLSSSEKVIGGPGNQYTIAPYFGSGPVKLVRVPRGNGTFIDLDFRMTYGVIDTFTAGSPAVSGVTMRVGVGTASPTGTPKGTDLIDTTPGTTDLKDAPLLVGKSLYDPVSKLTFKTLSVSSAGVVVSVTESVAPSMPGSLNATAASTPRVDLAWTAATDNVAVKSYKVSRNGTVVATVNAPATTWSDASVAHGTSYTYAVAAVDTSGNTGAAASKAVSTPAAPAPSPTPTPSPSASPTPTPTPSPSASPSVSPDPSASPDPSVSASPSPEPTPTATPDGPSAPQPLAGTPAITTVTLTWGAATGPDPIGGYRITRNGTEVARVAGDLLTWKDTGRKPSTYYTYTVSAIDTGFRTSSASSVTVKTKADTVRPSTPKNFRVVARSGAYVTFAWSASTDNVKVKLYRIYREGRRLNVGSTTGTKIRIYTLRGYKYFVRAVDTSGNRSYGSTHVRGR